MTVAVVFGATGETGKQLVKVLQSQKINPLCITRNPINGVECITLPDLSKLGPQSIPINAHIFCCIGTTRQKAGSAQKFYEIDHDLVINLAAKAAQRSPLSFHLVSSVGANDRSWFLYPRTKGLVEKDLTDVMNQCKVAIYRPALLLCDREEGRWAEKMARTCFVPIAEYLFPGHYAITCEHLARVMVHRAIHYEEMPSHSIMENLEIFNYDCSKQYS